MKSIPQLGCNVVVLILAASCTGCGESKRDVIGRYQQPCVQLRAKLKGYAASLPTVGSVKEPRVANALRPPLVYDAPGRRGNTEVVMESQLLDPDAAPEFDLNLSRNLLRCLAWTGPKNPMAESALNSSAGSIEQEFQQALEWEYLVVVRVVRFVSPEVVADGKFRGGELALEVFLIRASDGHVIAAFPVHASAADSVDVSYKASDSAAERAQAFVRSSAWQDARTKFSEELRHVSGGEFRLE